MRARVSGATGTLDAAPLSTRETVLCDTPTSSPIRFMVRRRSGRRPGRAAAGGEAGRPGERAGRTAWLAILQWYASMRMRRDHRLPPRTADRLPTTTVQGACVT